MTPPARRAPSPAVYDRLLESAATLTSEQGWSEVTMAKLADDVGVSRQTVYNSVGGKQDLAEALVLRELARFLDVVDTELGRGDDIVEAIRRTAERVYELAAENPLLKSTLSASHGKDSDELLPLLTTRSEPLMAAAQTTVGRHLDRFALPLDAHQQRVAVETVVRVVLSNVMQPTAAPDQAAADLAWIAQRVLQH